VALAASALEIGPHFLSTSLPDGFRTLFQILNNRCDFPGIRLNSAAIRPRYLRYGNMQETFNAVADIISETCNIDREKIRPESHTINDLGIDSLDFLDVTFAIDKRFGIKMPIEKWMQEINEGKGSVDDYFILNNLCTRIEELKAAKPA
jgi:acyl carrier protein